MSDPNNDKADASKGARTQVALSQDARRLLDSPNFASVATLMPDGAPKVEPVWVGREGDHILIATDSRGVKGRISPSTVGSRSR